MRKLRSNILFELILISFCSYGLRCDGQQKGVQITTSNGREPFTNLPFNDDTSKVQFAIVSDLWGGYRPGIFEKAVRKLELLQPQFVMSVGDLINGETYDSTLVEKEWDSFNKKLTPLTMPFFHVVGNHDIANPMMARVWIRRFGRAYYSFKYKNVLFLCIDTQDGSQYAGHSGMSNEQIQYFEHVIHDNPDVRWVFIFMHIPIWSYKNDKEEGFQKIEAALKGRNFTVFSGHYHTYRYVNKDGHKYFILATTGGGSELRGAKFGEFDELMWVVMNGDGPPKILNFKLDGLLNENIVDSTTFPITNTLINQSWLSTPSYVCNKEQEKVITPSLIFDNPTNYPLKIYGDLSGSGLYYIKPSEINVLIPPNTKRKFVLRVLPKKSKDLNINKIPSINVALNGTYRYDTTNYTLEANKTLLLSWKISLPEKPQAGELSYQQFKKGDTSGLFAIYKPEYIMNHWYWHGAKDCLIRFKLFHDRQYLYLVTFVHDDQLDLGKNERQGDVLYVDIEDKNGLQNHFIISPEWNNKFELSGKGKTSIPLKTIKIKGAIQDSMKCKIWLRMPLDEIEKRDSSVRFNIGYDDQDNLPEKHSSVLYWKPPWGGKGDYKNSGTYLISNK